MPPLPSPLHTPRRILWLAALAALMLHFLLFVVPWARWLPDLRAPQSKTPVSLNQVDPKKLEQIRQEWKRQAQKKLLLSKNQKTAAEAPKNADYEAEHNLTAEKEQRARQTDVLPKPGAKTPIAPPPPPPEKLAEPKKARDLPLSQLSPSLLAAPNQRQRSTPPPKTSKQSQSRAHASQSPSNQTPGADQALMDEKLPYGSENLLNAQESIYYSYYARIYEAIAPVWQSRIRMTGRRILPGIYTTQVEVVFDRNGQLNAVHYLRSSGILEFDRAVEEAWKKIPRFPNPPQTLLTSNGEVRTGWTFSVYVGNNMQWNSSDPERIY